MPRPTIADELGSRVAVTDTVMRDDEVAAAVARVRRRAGVVMIEIWPVEGLPEIREGDDLATMLAEPLRALGARDGDVVAITQKIVSKAEGRVVPDEGEGRSAWVDRETRRVVARRGELIIAETRHGFVCANAGVDASNVEAGLRLAPSTRSRRIRGGDQGGARALLGLSRLGVVMTDTFGRPWRNGLVNVAIGCAGLPALVDLRGERRPPRARAGGDGRRAGGRGGRGERPRRWARARACPSRSCGASTSVPPPPGRGADLVRPPDEDLFREGTMEP